jgi:3-isopropylmalate/(R)-2-methylmalate dehydratase small subunit
MMRLRARRIAGTVSTDDILPARYKHTSINPEELAKHVFEYFLPADFEPFAPGDCIIADSVFGIGSSREQAVSALLAAGISAVIGPAFGRIFYRNCWNLALPAIEADIYDCREGDSIHIDLAAGHIACRGTGFAFTPPPPLLLDVYRAGGLLRHVAAKTRARQSRSEQGEGL